MSLALDSQNSSEDDINGAFGTLEAFASLVFHVFLIVFLAFTLVVLVIESQVLQLSGLPRCVPSTFVKRAR